jgi:hypothetical protein
MTGSQGCMITLLLSDNLLQFITSFFHCTLVSLHMQWNRCIRHGLQFTAHVECMHEPIMTHDCPTGCACGCSLFVRADWYDKYFAYAMATGMEDYEEVIAPFKQQLFDKLWAGDAGPKDILDIGMGTGPNLKFYSGRPVR